MRRDEGSRERRRLVSAAPHRCPTRVRGGGWRECGARRAERTGREEGRAGEGRGGEGKTGGGGASV